MKEKIAIVGAGISGLSLAEKLKDKFEIEIFEKARGVGGRMSVKYHEKFQFDKGAQHFTVRSDEFHDFLQEPIAKGIIGLWKAKFAEINYDKILHVRNWGEKNKHYVALPKMNSLAKFLSQNKKVHLATEIENCKRVNKKWFLKAKNGENFGEFGYLFFSSPVEQTLNLIDKNFNQIEILKNKEMLPCFSLMVGLKEKLDLDFDAALVKNSKISWISVDSSKPERPEGFSLLANSTNLWAKENLENDQQKVKDELTVELGKILKFKEGEIKFCELHRWRYANIGLQDCEKSLYDAKLKVGVCGDFMIQGRIEAGFLSASNLAKKIV